MDLSVFTMDLVKASKKKCHLDGQEKSDSEKVRQASEGGAAMPSRAA